MRERARQLYGLKGKSRWVREAVVELLDSEPVLESVGAGEDLMQHNVLDVVDLGDELPRRIERAMVLLRRQDPLMEGVQSAIIRAAIRRRLANDHRNC
jgi:hypothetical protein